MQVTPECNPDGLDMIHGPKAKNGGATLRQILDVKLFRRFPFILNDSRHATSAIGKAISLTSQGV
jgi:hypothetical protein